MKNLVLALDCSLRRTHVALLADGDVMARGQQDQLRRQAAELPLMVGQVLAAAKKTLREVTLLAVTNGPGYFTGIRVGVSYAAALAYGLNVRIVPVSTLALLAAPYTRRQQPVLAVVYAGRECVYAASFGCADNLPTGEYRKEALVPWLERHPCAVISDDPDRACASVPLVCNVERALPDAADMARLCTESEALYPMDLRIAYHRDPDLGKPKTIPPL